MDSDFAGDPNSLKSTTGMLVLDRYGSIVAWHSKKQSIKANSMADAEFIATATRTDEAVWIQKMDIELQTLPHIYNLKKSYIPLHVYSHNQANIQNASMSIHQTKSKTVGVKFHWLVDQVNHPPYRKCLKEKMQLLGEQPGKVRWTQCRRIKHGS